MSKKDKLESEFDESIDWRERLKKEIEESAADADRDVDGFIPLIPTEEGKRLLASYGAINDTMVLEDCIQTKLNAIEAGKWDDARLSRAERRSITTFIDAFANTPVEIIEDDQLILANKLLEYAKSWYEYGTNFAMMPDGEYDKLLAAYLRLGMIEPVGVVPVGNNTTATEIKNPRLHNNLDKCYRIYETDDIPEGTAEKQSIERWLARCFDIRGFNKNDPMTLMVAHKLDGVSVIADINSDGVITSAQSRGDETKAMDIKGLVGMKVSDDKLSSEVKPFSIQYEMFCTHKQREMAAEAVEVNDYKSNRSAVAGIRKRLETTSIPNIEEIISLYPITAEGVYDDSGELKNYEELMDFIQNFAKVPEDMVFPVFITGDFHSLIDQIKGIFIDTQDLRSKLSYPIDGLVITIANEEAQELIGRDGRTNRFQIALKFNPASEDCEVAGLNLSAGNKGYRTIMVELAHPIFIDGAEYTEVQVLSARQFDELQLDEGCTVRVHRTGDVIPRITKIKEGNGKPLELPTVCPTCLSPLIRENQKLKCTNPNCKENIAGRIRAFFNVLEIDGYSDSFAMKLVEVGHRSPVSLFNISVENLRDAGINGKVAEAFPAVMAEKLANTRDYVLLASLGLPGIGKETSRKILRACKLNELACANYTTLYMAIQGLPGIKTKAEDIARTLYSAQDEISQIANIVKPDMITNPNEKVVMIGHTGIAPGPTVKFWIDKVGLDLTDGANFDILLVADKETKSRKAERARKRNLPMYIEDELISELKSRYFQKVMRELAESEDTIMTQALATV